MTRRESLAKLLAEIRACRVCAPFLPHGVRPIIRASKTAKILIAAQAPGIRVHETGLSFNDPSGVRLRDWLGVDRAGDILRRDRLARRRGGEEVEDCVFDRRGHPTRPA